MLGNAMLLALRAIGRNPMRSFLTVLGIVIGVAAVITMVTLGNGATRSIQEQIGSMGSNLLTVRPGRRMGPPEGAANFRSADVEALAREVHEADAVVPVASASVTVVRNARNWSTSVTGTTSDYLFANKWALADGRSFTAAEQRAGTAVCLLGATVRRELFGSADPLGEHIRVGKFACQVIGMLAARGQSAMGRDQDDTVLMPLRTVQRRLNGTPDIGYIQVAVRNVNSLDTAKNLVTGIMRERRRIGRNQNDDFMVMDPRQLMEALTGTTRTMTTLLGAVAAVSLLVGGVGIMNIMLVSVTERTREIGIRLAIGALEREVLLQFLVEAVVLATLGGLAGIVLATIVSLSIAHAMNLPFVFTSGVYLLSFAFSALIGVLFGYFPARRAARLDPIDALRHE
ncbi:MAG: ABC transporter permease [Pseudomonadales bacterium]|jgi:putative ABC transport system permease protein|nr:ABC transporter permease [Pseudomonadales bacterium]MCP5320971.1 ABC transporter permease [Pseudomonadales bacterium]